eukprot:Sspe_Gene.42288::Locus_20531_Transcript_1_1_Confidence_1.000_Length_3288::g.42288::m.42288
MATQTQLLIHESPVRSQPVPSTPPADSVRTGVPGASKAVFVAAGYLGSPAETGAPAMAVTTLQQHLLKWGFTAQRRVLVDECPQFRPTRTAILSSLAWLAEDAQPGDSLLFAFVGHGSDEALLPVDWETAGDITPAVFRDELVALLPFGVRLTCIFDVSKGGGGAFLRLPFCYKMPSGSVSEQPYQAGGAHVTALGSGPGAVSLGSITLSFCSVMQQAEAEPPVVVLMKEMQQRCQLALGTEGTCGVWMGCSNRIIPEDIFHLGVLPTRKGPSTTRSGRRSCPPLTFTEAHPNLFDTPVRGGSKRSTEDKATSPVIPDSPPPSKPRRSSVPPDDTPPAPTPPSPPPPPPDSEPPTPQKPPVLPLTTIPPSAPSRIPGASKVLLISAGHTTISSAEVIDLIRRFLQRVGYHAETCIVSDTDPYPKPSKETIKRAFEWFTTDVQPGDCLFLLLSGCLVDQEIIKKDLYSSVVARLPLGARLTVLVTTECESDSSLPGFPYVIHCGDAGVHMYEHPYSEPLGHALAVCAVLPRGEVGGGLLPAAYVSVMNQAKESSHGDLAVDLWKFIKEERKHIMGCVRLCSTKRLQLMDPVRLGVVQAEDRDRVSCVESSLPPTPRMDFTHTPLTSLHGAPPLAFLRGEVEDKVPQEVREQVEAFYSRMNPAKLPQLDTILAEYVDSWDELYADLEERYSTPNFFANRKRLLAFLEEVDPTRVKEADTLLDAGPFELVWGQLVKEYRPVSPQRGVVDGGDDDLLHFHNISSKGSLEPSQAAHVASAYPEGERHRPSLMLSQWHTSRRALDAQAMTPFPSVPSDISGDTRLRKEAAEEKYKKLKAQTDAFLDRVERMRESGLLSSSHV